MSMSRIEDLLEQILDKINGGSENNANEENSPIIVTVPSENVGVYETNYFPNNPVLVSTLMDGVSISGNAIAGELNYIPDSLSDDAHYFLALSASINGMEYDSSAGLYEDGDGKKYFFCMAITSADATIDDVVNDSDKIYTYGGWVDDGLVLFSIPDTFVAYSAKVIFALVELASGGMAPAENGTVYTKELSTTGLVFEDPNEHGGSIT